MRPHKKLIVWEKILMLVEEIYKMTSLFPKEEVYGITSQMRRAAISIASNVAEGSARKGIQEKIQFFTISKASLSELDAQLEISLRLKYIDENKYGNALAKMENISSMLQGLINCQNGKVNGRLGDEGTRKLRD